MPRGSASVTQTPRRDSSSATAQPTIPPPRIRTSVRLFIVNRFSGGHKAGQDRPEDRTANQGNPAYSAQVQLRIGHNPCGRSGTALAEHTTGQGVPDVEQQGCGRATGIAG